MITSSNIQKSITLSFLIYIQTQPKMNSKKFMEEVKSLAKGNTENNGEIIWRALEDPEAGEDNVYHFSMQIFQMLMQLQKKPIVYENQERMLATLLILEFYKNTRKKNDKVVEECKKLLSHRKNQIYGHGIFIILLFLLNAEEVQFPQTLISRYIFCPRTINWKIEPAEQLQDKMDEGVIYTTHLKGHLSQKFYDCLKKISHPRQLTREISSLCFSYVCYTDYIRVRQNEIKKSIYDYLLQSLKAQIHGLRKINRNMPHIIFLINFIQNMITFYGCQFPDITKEFLLLFNQLRNNPNILGQMAYENFNMIHKQLKIPGTAFRKQLKWDFPFLDIEGKKLIGKQFYMVTKEDDVFSCPEYCSLMTLRKLIIFQVVKSCEFDNNQLYLQIINKLEEQKTYVAYYKVMKILDIAMSLQVYDKIKKIKKISINELFKKINQEIEDDDKYVYPKKQQILQFNNLLNEHKMGIFKYPDYQIIHVPISRFVNQSKEYSFKNIIDRNSNEEFTFYKNKIPLIFYGNDQQFTKILDFICEYLEKTDIQQSRLLKIYYIPHCQGNSSISTYLSIKDLMYRRFVYQPFKDKMIFPYIELSLKNKDLFPTYIYNKLIQTYLREAKRTAPIRVYRCILQGKDSGKVIQTYFYSSICIGCSADAEFVRLKKLKDKQKEKRYQQIDYIQLLTTKIKKIIPFTVNIEMNEVDEFTHKIYKKVQKNMRVEDIQICNLPHDYFIGNAPNPSSSALQVSILTENYGKIFRKQVVNKENFQNINENDVNETIQAFKDLFITTSVQKFKMTLVNYKVKQKDRDHYFNVYLDGNLFDRIETLTIEPVYNVNGLPVSLPIQCFLPFS